MFDSRNIVQTSRFSLKYLLLPMLLVAVVGMLFAASYVNPVKASGVIYVNHAATGTPDGTSWKNAYPNLQDALAIANSGDEIWVAAGVYYPDEGSNQIDNSRESTFMLVNGVAIYGGFAGTETTRTARDWYTNLTILSGDIHQDDLVNANGVVTDSVHIVGSNAYHVVMSSAVVSSTILDGVTITAGQANGSSPNDDGGGIYNFFNSNATFSHLTIQGNTASVGGGIYSSNDTATYTNLAVINNTASSAGGVYSSSSNATWTNVTIQGNIALNDGGGLYIADGNPVWINILISGNSSNGTLGGGGMYHTSVDAPATFINMTISGNSTTGNGGGLYNAKGDLLIQNSLIWNNQDSSGLGTAEASLSMGMESGYVDVTYTLMQGHNLTGTGNLDGTLSSNDPLFVNPISPNNVPTTAGNYRLISGSPAIDAGNNSLVPVGLTKDIEGILARISDGNKDSTDTVDMGAYENGFDTIVQFSNATYTTSEISGSVTITVSLSASTTHSVTVNYVTSDGTATAGSDYTAITGTLTITAGYTIGTVTIPINVDGTPEIEETFSLILSAPTNATLGTPSRATVTITDGSLGIPTIQFSNATYRARETDGSATITVTLNTTATHDVMISYTTSDGTATAGSDYITTTGTLTISTGVTSSTLRIPIISDVLTENDETLLISLSNPISTALGTTTNVTLTILDEFPPTVQFSRANYMVNETDGSAMITVTLSNSINQTVTVAYATGDGTATAGSDYTAITGTLTIPSQCISGTFSIPISRDPFVEEDEIIPLALSNPSNALLGVLFNALLEISDGVPDLPTLQWQYTSDRVSESVGSILLTVTLNTTSTKEISVAFASGKGEALAGSDYTLSDTLVTIPSGQISTTIVLSVTDDYTIEGDERIVLTLQHPTNVLIGSHSSMQLTIIDNDAPTAGIIHFDTTSYTINEDDGIATLTIQRSGGSDGTVMVRYDTFDDTATSDSDYTTMSGMLTFADGQTSNTISIPIINDSLVEGNETIGVILSNSTGGAELGTRSHIVVHIHDDDSTTNGSGVIHMNTSSITVNEGDGTATITIQRSGGISGTVSVQYDTLDETTTAGSDYPRSTGIITFTNVATSTTLLIPVTDDYIVEGTESTLIRLNNVSGGAELGAQDYTRIHIYDNDSLPEEHGTIQFHTSTATVAEDSRIGCIFVERTGGSNGSVMVEYALYDGSATSGSDYVRQDGVLFFAPGETRQRISVIVTDDNIQEGHEYFILELSNVTGGAQLGTQNRTNITIVDNETHPQGIVHWSLDRYRSYEDRQAFVTVQRSGGRSGEVQVDYIGVDGTAQEGSDYPAAQGTITFADGEMRKTLAISLTNDPDIEGDETFSLILSNVTGGALLGTQTKTTITIIDDDTPSMGILQFGSERYDFHEDGGIAAIPVERLGYNDNIVQVQYVLSGTTAIEGSDFAVISDTLTFANGEVRQTISISITDDQKIEAVEEFQIELTTIHGDALLGSQYQATVTIIDNDGLSDAFEDDNTCNKAQPISVDGSTQKHTFNPLQQDVDWMVMDAIAGKTYRIEIVVPPNSPVDARLELFDLCTDKTFSNEQDHQFTPDVRFTFKSQRTGPVYLKVFNSQSILKQQYTRLSAVNSLARYTISVNEIQAPDPGAVILVAGKISDDDPLQPNMHAVTNAMYQFFRDQGYSADRIFYLATDTTLDGDGDGQTDVDDTATAAHLQEAITSWAVDKVDANKPFLLYMIDHGAYDQLHLNKEAGETVSPVEIAAWLSQLESQKPQAYIRVVLESCNSGSFIDLYQTLSQIGRTIITSTTPDNLSYANDNGAIFSNYLLNGLRQGETLIGSFEKAAWAATTIHPDQVPWIDSNGNGVPNETADIEVWESLPSTSGNVWPPYITSVTTTLSTKAGQGTIRATVQDDDDVKYVGAVIYPPSYKPPKTSDKLVRDIFPINELHKQSGDEYTFEYKNFTEKGTYRIVFYAQDNDSIEAQPVVGTINIENSVPEDPYVYLPIVMRILPLCNDEESNNTKEKAQNVTLNQACQGILEDSLWGQSAYYQFNIQKLSNITIFLRNIPDGADYNIQLLSQDGSVLDSSSKTGNADEQIVKSVPAGTYYIHIYKHFSDESEEGTYVLSVKTHSF